jgi:hypothetical protein
MGVVDLPMLFIVKTKRESTGYGNIGNWAITRHSPGN